MSQQLLCREFDNGLTLLGEPMDSVESAAMAIALPAGCRHDPPGLEGSASVAAEWLLRGAGQRDTRSLNEALDNLGCHHSESVQSDFLTLASAQLGRNLHDILAIYADILRQPLLQEATFDPCRQLVAQDLDSLEDEPARQCNLLMRGHYFPAPLGNLPLGNDNALATMQADPLREHLRQHLTPQGTLLAVAGAFDWDAICKRIDSLLGDWQGATVTQPQPTAAQRGVTHIQKDSAQMHIALAQAAPRCDDKDYYPARIAEAIASRGMGSRLFTEVREKRGLAYHVGMRYVALKEQAGLFTYAGTRPDLAQQTFDVTTAEIQRLALDITDEELARAKTQIRSSVVMEGQSTFARAQSLASDYYHLGRLRPLEELSAAIQAVSRDAVMDYLERFTPKAFTILTVGPAPIDPHGLVEEGDV